MTSEAKVAAECCFVDVAQGSANIILLGNQRAIVVDAGPRNSFALIRCLEYFGVESLAALVLTHNDSDHCGAAEIVLGNYPRRIDAVYFLEDRPTERNLILERLRQEIQCGNLSRTQIRRLECDRIIHRDVEKKLELRVLFPTMLENIDARDRSRPNDTSGVLYCVCGDHGILFPGDAAIEELKGLSTRGALPRECDVVVVPHHAGRLGSTAAEYAWVYGNAIRCRIAIVSVGTLNAYGHPLEEHINAMVESGATVMCTQITPGCCQRIELLRPGVGRSTLPGASSPDRHLSKSGRSKNVACAGTILAELTAAGVRVQGLTEHQAGVDRIASSGLADPLCRRRP